MSVIHVVGLPASGKSTLGWKLAQALGWSFVSIDDERIRLLRPGRYWPDDDNVAWQRFYAKALSRDSIIESVAPVPIAVHRTILCLAPSDLRRRRLIHRQRTGYPLARHNRRYVERLMAIPAPVVVPDAEWDGSRPAPIGPLLIALHLD